MKKRLISLLLVLLMVSALTISSAAFVDQGCIYVVADDMYTDQMASARDIIADYSEQLSFDLHVDIVSDTEGESTMKYAQIFYEQYQYGYGENLDGALLMILIDDNETSVDLKDFALYGGGSGADLINSADGDSLNDALSSILTGENLSYQEAGDICARAIQIYGDAFSAMLGGAQTRSDLVLVEGTEPTESAAEAAMEQGTLIRDYAGLLSDSERDRLEQKAKELEETYQCCTYVLTVDSLNGAERRNFAKQYYTDHDLGCGAWRNGILFLVAMESREYVTITYGRDPENLTDYGIGIYAFSDYGIEKLEDKVVPELSDEAYYDAFDTYLSTCESYLKQYTETGEPFDVGNAPRSIFIPLLITIFVPILIAFLVCMIFRSQMKTAIKATQADNYIPRDGFNLTHQIDQYTHTTQTRRTIERSNSSGGGSSVDSGGFGGSSGGHF